MLKRSGSKSIAIDGQRYRYIVSEAGSDASGRAPLAITVQHDDANGARLRIIGLTAHRIPAKDSKFYCGRTVDRPIHPRHVERLIRLATARGWQALTPGAVFSLEADRTLD